MSLHAMARMARQWAPRGLLVLAEVTIGLAWSGANSAPAQASAPDTVVYQLLPSSRLEVRTGKSGLFGFAGHNHVIRARAFTGSVQYRPGNLSASRLEITIPAESLEVMSPSDTAEIRQVTETMRTQVLHVDQYPEIHFTATQAVLTAAGLVLDGELTMVGQTRPVKVTAMVQVDPDTLRARGSFAVNQTDFGIKPYKGGPGGAVQVANRVQFDFDAVAVREPASAAAQSGGHGGTPGTSANGGGP
jgi:polyisoprenoid-binding protein YceI